MRGGLAPIVVLVGACSFDARLPISTDPDADGTRIDAVPGSIDAAGTDRPDAAANVTCPASYNLSRQTSRYRVSSTKATWVDGEAACDDDTNGQWTHLVAIDTDVEWSWVVGAAALSHGGEWLSIGVLRDLDSPGGPWRTVTGGAAPVVYWRQTTFSVDEPNNGSGDEAVVVLDPFFNITHTPSAGGFIDFPVEGTAYYLCECDGKAPVDADYD